MQRALLSSAEIARLLAVLPEDHKFEEGGPEVRFEDVAQEFERQFEPRDRFRACCAIVLLLEDPGLLGAGQRVALWYVLWSAFRGGRLEDNPFISYIVEGVAAPGGALPERCLLLQLLQGRSLATVSGLTVQTFCASADALGAAPALDVAALRRQYREGSAALLEGASSFRRAAISRLVSADPAAAPPAAGAGGAAGAAAAAAAAGAAARLTLEGFEPAWVRPRPGVLAPAFGELRWLQLPLGQELLWDSTLGEDPSRLQVVRDLVSKALKGPLLPAQQQQVLSELEANPKLVHALGLGAEQLPALVEHTPVIAYELLVRLMASRSIHDYFQVLASMQMSLHSMEVVNRLTSAVDLPTEFVHRYITNCINSCEEIQDKYMQNRLVRLVCVFLQSLIRNKIINIRDLLHEVQAFCINYSRIREAAALFRLLKQMD